MKLFIQRRHYNYQPSSHATAIVSYFYRIEKSRKYAQDWPKTDTKKWYSARLLKS